jgi:hypothetical protein
LRVISAIRRSITAISAFTGPDLWSCGRSATITLGRVRIASTLLQTASSSASIVIARGWRGAADATWAGAGLFPPLPGGSPPHYGVTGGFRWSPGLYDTRAAPAQPSFAAPTNRILPRMSEPDLSDEMIREAMPRAEKAVCPPVDQRCSGFPYDARTALASRISAGWCRIVWVAANSGRPTWDAWHNVRTGEGWLRKSPNEQTGRSAR